MAPHARHMFEVVPIASARLGAEVRLLHGRLDELSPEQFDELRAALNKHCLLVFRDQGSLHPAAAAAFVRRFDPAARTVWRDQKTNPWELYKAKHLGGAGTFQLPACPECLCLGNGRVDGHFGLSATLGGRRPAYGSAGGSQVIGGGQLQWHIDGAFWASRAASGLPCRVTAMRCFASPGEDGSSHEISLGDGTSFVAARGATAFVSAREAFERLTPREKEWALRTTVRYAVHPFKRFAKLGMTGDGLKCVGGPGDETALSEEDLREGGGAMRLPLLWRHPGTGHLALMPHTRCMEALEVSREGEDGPERPAVELGQAAAREHLYTLMRRAVDVDSIYAHAWRKGDLVLWDNWCLWHSATGGVRPEDLRIMHLIAFDGSSRPSCAPAEADPPPKVPQAGPPGLLAELSAPAVDSSSPPSCATAEAGLASRVPLAAEANGPAPALDGKRPPSGAPGGSSSPSRAPSDVDLPPKAPPEAAPELPRPASNGGSRTPFAAWKELPASSSSPSRALSEVGLPREARPGAAPQLPRPASDGSSRTACAASDAGPPLGAPSASSVQLPALRKAAPESPRPASDSGSRTSGAPSDVGPRTAAPVELPVLALLIGQAPRPDLLRPMEEYLRARFPPPVHIEITCRGALDDVDFGDRPIDESMTVRLGADSTEEPSAESDGACPLVTRLSNGARATVEQGVVTPLLQHQIRRAVAERDVEGKPPFAAAIVLCAGAFLGLHGGHDLPLVLPSAAAVAKLHALLNRRRAHRLTLIVPNEAQGPFAVARWLRRGNFSATYGILRERASEEELRELVAECCRGGDSKVPMACVLDYVGHSPAMVEAAEQVASEYGAVFVDTGTAGITSLGSLLESKVERG